MASIKRDSFWLVYLLCMPAPNQRPRTPDSAIVDTGSRRDPLFTVTQPPSRKKFSFPRGVSREAFSNQANREV